MSNPGFVSVFDMPISPLAWRRLHGFHTLWAPTGWIRGFTLEELTALSTARAVMDAVAARGLLAKREDYEEDVEAGLSEDYEPTLTANNDEPNLSLQVTLEAHDCCMNGRILADGTAHLKLCGLGWHTFLLELTVGPGGPSEVALTDLKLDSSALYDRHWQALFRTLDVFDVSVLAYPDALVRAGSRHDKIVYARKAADDAWTAAHKTAYLALENRDQPALVAVLLRAFDNSRSIALDAAERAAAPRPDA